MEAQFVLNYIFIINTHSSQNVGFNLFKNYEFKNVGMEESMQKLNRNKNGENGLYFGMVVS